MSTWFSIIKYFLIKDIKARYAGSGLGVLWTFLMPAVQILLLWFVFSAIMKARPYADTQIPYIYFLLSSYFFWTAFLEGSMRAAHSIVENAEIVKKVSFPTIVLPVTVSLSSYLPNILGFTLFCFFYVLKTSFSPTLFFLVPVLLLQIIFSVGIGMLLSALVPYVRDLGQILGQILQGVFFLSPIIYSMDSVPEKLKIVFYLNPITYFVSSYQKIILLREAPSLSFFAVIICLAAGSLIIGYSSFMKLREGFSDVL